MRNWKMLCFLMTFIALNRVPEIAAQTGATPIDPQILQFIVKIDTPSERTKAPITGTGFIISFEIKSAPTETKREYFLVTNKHMVSDWTLADGDIKQYNKYLQVQFYRTDFSPEHPTQNLRVDLCDEQGRKIEKKVQSHSNPSVDVAVIYLDEGVIKKLGANIPSFTKSLLSFDKITSYFFNIGDQVFVLGYPLGITSLSNNYPIAKFGYIAATPGEEFSIKMMSPNRKGEQKEIKLSGKLLIVDGLIVPGNSGGPVVLPSIVKTRINPVSKSWEHLTEPIPNAVIGILAGGFGSSGLSYAYSSDYILETVMDYFEKNAVPETSNKPQ